MKIILFGGTGLIGSALLEHPRVKGHELVVVSRNPAPLSPVQGVTFTGYDPIELSSYFSDDYAVINLAGASIDFWPWTPARKRRILASRVKVSNLIARLINESSDKPRVVLQGSAVGYYGSRGDEVLTEASHHGEGFLAEVTQKWEAALGNQLPENLRVVYLRTGLVLSAKGGLLKKLVLPMQFFAGGYFGNGKQWMPWIHIDDEVAAILFLLEHPSASGVFNLVGPRPVRMNDFFRMLGRQLGRPAWFHIPAWLIRGLAGDFGKELLLISQRAMPDRLLHEGFSFGHMELSETFEKIYGHG